MMIYELYTPVGIVALKLASSSPHESQLLEYDGNATLAERIESWLTQEYGAFGHLIGDRTTPLDLHHAMQMPEAKQYSPRLVAGEDLVASYEPGIPDGALS